MDHREQTQKESEQWQGTAIKIIQRFRYGVAAVAILGLLVLFVQNLGFPKQIDETYPASVITADGKTLDISLTIRGEVTNYPFKSEKYNLGDQITVSVSGSNQQIIRLIPALAEGFFFGQRDDAVGILTYERDQLLLETDLQSLFPDMQSGTCLVYYGYDSFDLPGEYAQYFTFLQE